MTKKEKKNKKNILIYFILFISLIFIYSYYIEPYNLTIKEYKIENNNIPNNFDGLKIIHLTDIHYGSSVDIDYIKKIVKLINKQKPDLVFLTGDFLDKRFNPNKKEIKKLKKEINKIESTLGNFAVNGNHDIKYLNDFESILKENFTILNNEEKLIYYKKNTPISITGFKDSTESDPNYDLLKNEVNYFRFVLIHEPDEFDKIKDYNFNIMLSGHSHHGQVRVPLIGKIYTPVGSKKYYDEYYNINNKELFISNGIGTSTLDIRFMSEPSINLYRIYAQ